MEKKIVYFETPGKENTAEVLSLIKDRALSGSIKKIVLASTRGDTARAACDYFDDTGIQLIVVPHQFGRRTGQRFPTDLVKELEAKGHRVYFGTMLFHTEELYGFQTPKIMATLLRVFCQGIKVCVEIVMMACDGGLVAEGEEVIVVAGAAVGADTAVVATTAPSTKLTNLHFSEIICKPL